MKTFHLAGGSRVDVRNTDDRRSAVVDLVRLDGSAHRRLVLEVWQSESITLSAATSLVVSDRVEVAVVRPLDDPAPAVEVIP